MLTYHLICNETALGKISKKMIQIATEQVYYVFALMKVERCIFSVIESMKPFISAYGDVSYLVALSWHWIGTMRTSHGQQSRTGPGSRGPSYRPTRGRTVGRHQEQPQSQTPPW